MKDIIWGVEAFVTNTRQKVGGVSIDMQMGKKDAMNVKFLYSGMGIHAHVVGNYWELDPDQSKQKFMQTNITTRNQFYKMTFQISLRLMIEFEEKWTFFVHMFSSHAKFWLDLAWKILGFLDQFCHNIVGMYCIH